jgi:hypothetical protein
MKGRFIVALVAAAALFLPELAEAQRPGSIELGAVGRFAIYDDEVGLQHTPAIGARAGIFFLNNVAFELDWTYSEPELEDPPGWQGREWIRHGLFQGRVVYTHWMGERAGLLMGAGFSYDDFSTPRRVGARGGGPGGLLGMRFRFSDMFSARVEGTAYYVPEDEGAHVTHRPQTLNLGVQAGLSLMLRDREPVERVVELPPPPPDTVVVTREVEPTLPEGTPAQVCLATGESVTVYMTPQGDTLVGPRRVNVRDLGPGVAFAGEYAEGRDWFVQDRAVVHRDVVDGREHDLEYVRVGGDLTLNCADIRRVGEFEGVPLFVDSASQSPYERIYVPVRPGVWQAYQTDLARVRG